MGNGKWREGDFYAIIGKVCIMMKYVYIDEIHDSFNNSCKVIEIVESAYVKLSTINTDR